MDKPNSHEHYLSQVLHINAQLEHDISQDHKLVSKLQDDLNGLIQQYSKTNIPGKDLYLLYQAQSLLRFRQGDTAGAIDYMHQAVTANGTNYDFADEFLSSVDPFYTQPENKSRINRGTYLLSYVLANVAYWALVLGIGLAIAYLTNTRNRDGINLITGIMIYVAWIPYFAYLFALMIKRLHDLDKSGWWSLFVFVPLVNLVFNFYLVIAAGDQKSNVYGMPPRKTYIVGALFK